MQTYKEKIRRLSQRIVDAQRPIRILDSIKWPAHVEQEFLKSKGKELPRLEPSDYAPLGFDVDLLKNEFLELSSAVDRELGKDDALGGLLKRITDEYRLVLEMLSNRGTKMFWEYSRKLYGSPRDHFFEDQNTISDLGQLMYSILGKIEGQTLGQSYPETLSAAMSCRG